ncbi:MAG: hypothetical protein WCO98_10895 [bacterium]
MKKQAGLWIDHRKAVVVLITGKSEEIKEVLSRTEKRDRFTGGTDSENNSIEDILDNRFKNHLNSYYDEVIAVIREAESFLIIGPGEAKGELGKRIEHEGLVKRILAIETVDKMTNPQIAAIVRERFSEKVKNN